MRQPRSEFPNRPLETHADARVQWAGHAGIALKGCTQRQQARVCGRNVRVRTDHGGNTTIERGGKTNFLTRRFGMKVHEDRSQIRILEHALERREWLLVQVHVQAPKDVDDSDFLRPNCERAPTTPRRSERKIERTNHSRIIEQPKNFFVVPNMIAHRHGIHARFGQRLKTFTVHAETTRRILGVRDHEIELGTNRRQVIRHQHTARFSEDIANKQNSHSSPSVKTRKPRF